MVTITPFKFNSSKSSGIAVISFDFSYVFTCPNHTPSLVAHTDTMQTALCLFPLPGCGLYSELHSVLPSITITSFSLSLFRNVSHAYSNSITLTFVFFYPLLFNVGIKKILNFINLLHYRRHKGVLS